MPTWRKLDPAQRRRVIRSINLKITALLAAKRNLRRRRDTVANLSDSELLLIQLELVRLQAKIDGLNDEKDAFKLDQRSLAPPSLQALSAMKAKVQAISAINVRNTTARRIIGAATAIAGGLRAVSLT